HLFAQHEPPVFDEDFADSQPDQDDFSAEDERVVHLESPEPLVEEPKIERRRIRGPYKIPSDLLDTYSNGEYWVIDEETKQAASDLKDTLSEFKIEAEVTGIRKGPVVTMFEILPAPGVKLSKIVALQDNIALRLAASSVRIVAPIPGKHAVGIEVPNKERAVVSFKEIVDLDLPQFSKMAIPVILGKDISGEPRVLDLAKTPHLLIAGSTGAGKSVCVNSMILSILYKRSPQDVKLIMIDPKVVELKLYNDIPHLLTPVITESKRAFQSLQYCLCEMERRYACLDGMGVRDIASYNKRIVERNIAAEKLPYIVVIIDEFADLMATTGKELESTIARLAAMSRAVGIHLVLATQRPSIDVITGLIKANIPSRIAFMVASKMDSRIIIDQVGAEKLLGKGDMLFASATDPFPVRIQGTLVNDNEVEHVVEFVKQYGEPEYIDDEIFVDDDDDDSSGPGLFGDGDDPLYDEALQIVMQAGKASASYIQRRLKIGYNRAARLVEEMEERGIVGPANGSKPREVICVP
ncbi:MAG: DNA translocase FtsK, partial [Treponemataceae bacterium]|nr:DNA translocase FtsK [Treponemataceae bacterium]